MSGDFSSRAEVSCSACKRLKRKCDKQVPKCSLCLRTGRICDYITPSDPSPSAADFAAVQSRVAELEQRLAAGPKNQQQFEEHSSSCLTLPGDFGGYNTLLPGHFPTALFLDVDLYKYSRMRMPEPFIEIPEVSPAPPLQLHTET